MEKIVIVLVLFVATYIVIFTWLSFRKAFLKKKKDKKLALDVLRTRELLDEEIYNEVEIEKVHIISKDNLKLEGNLIKKFNNNNFVILVHGYSDNYHMEMVFVRMFLKEKFNILLVDQRGYGKSEGKYASYGYYESEDICLWIEYLANRFGEDIVLGLHGQSMGGSTCLLCGAKNNKVKFVVDDCGFSKAKDIVKYRFGRYKIIIEPIIYPFLRFIAKIFCKFDFELVNPIDEIVKRDDLSILFIHGTEDESVPCEMSEQMYKIRNNKNDILLLINGAGHIQAYRHGKDEYEKNVHEIIKRSIEKDS